MDIHAADKQYEYLKIPLRYNKLDSNFDIRMVFYNMDVFGVNIISCIGCHGTPDSKHGLCIADIRGNGYYTAIFLPLNGGIYVANNNGGGTYQDVLWNLIQ